MTDPTGPSRKTGSFLSAPALHLDRRSLMKTGGALAGLFFAPGALTLGGATRAYAADQFIHQLGWIKSIQFGGHFAAIEKGYFAEEGIDAVFEAGGPGMDGAALVASGQVMTSDGDVESTVRNRINGIPVKAFAAIMQKAPGAIMSLASKPIKTLADFPGKTIALPNATRPQMDALMTAAGLDPASVNYVPVGTDPGILAAGQVDGYYGWATNQGVMLKTRGVDIEVAYMNDLGLPGYAGVLYATDESIDTKADLIVRWLKAEIKGWQWFLDNPEEMAKLMVDKYGQRGLDLAAQTAEAGVYKDFIPVGDAAKNGLLWIEPDVFAKGIEFSIKAGDLKEGQVKVEDVVTQTLIAKAHGKA
ncbi:ABC transporter substrate-binding protein [Prosthecomicrobium pneumaticum]|uniref:NitT/TauT family transport system substrate-binding protein n=1 Tax=Prosthecomicrobium pneumaticum TaxID=81895 RepID=A0A7W9CVL3_9HYPH|nr:ABC transporter substrate-binding protein [Prosthecomicrobium pneumaticum]MBB5752708.1 NitT/TauT family transport system substrate-binding protein [Prosthecomicrobium pneumaticum]